ncbi:MAG: cation transporter [Elusimicrobia bacterium]|nr:cation transporter [Elusimicrobiota bacterium]
MSGRLLASLLLLATLQLAAGPVRARDPLAPPADDTTFEILRPGTYVCDVSGLLCEACARVIAETVSKVKGVQKATMDFPNHELTLIIADNKTVPTAAILRALRKAAVRVNLGTQYHLTKVRYVP